MSQEKAWGEIDFSPGLKSLLNGESPLKWLFSPGTRFICPGKQSCMIHIGGIVHLFVLVHSYL